METQIILIDAYAQIYRNFFALPPFSNTKGQPTNAIFGIAKFLLALDKEYATPLGATVFDLGRSKSRLKIAPDYKANRPPMPDALCCQIPYIKEWMKASGWPILESEGREADDIIAAIAMTFTDYPIRIVSSDKDIAQIVDDRIQMLIPDRKGGGLHISGPNEIIQKFSVSSDHIVDYLSLIGDNSDNIPGIDGVGPKTAAVLIAQFGSIESMLERFSEIKNEKLREKIRTSSELLAKNKLLITLDAGIPDDNWKNLETIKRLQPDWEKLTEIAEELELKSIIREIEKLQSQNSGNQAVSRKNDIPKSAYTPDLL